MTGPQFLDSSNRSCIRCKAIQPGYNGSETDRGWMCDYCLTAMEAPTFWQFLTANMTRLETTDPSTLTASDPRESEAPDLDHLPERTYP